MYGPGAQGIYNDPTHGVIMYYRYGEFFLENIFESLLDLLLRLFYCC